MGELRVLLSTRIIGIRIRIMGRSRLEVVYIRNMLNRGRGKWLPNLLIFSDMIKGTTSIIRRG